MVSLNLNDEERRILLHLLENCMTELRGEIYHTESLEYKEMLHARKRILQHLLDELQPRSEELPSVG